jgi:hypothetical protein
MAFSECCTFSFSVWWSWGSKNIKVLTHSVLKPQVSDLKTDQHYDGKIQTLTCLVFTILIF